MSAGTAGRARLAARPARDDETWFWHLNVRRSAAGAPEFIKRAVAPYRVPVPEFTVPSRDRAEIMLGDVIGPVGPELTARGSIVAARAPGSTAPAQDPGHLPQLVELLRLAETGPPADAFTAFLADSDARVRRAAVTALTETYPAGTGLLLARACADEHGTVRHAAAASLRELAEVLPVQAEPGLRAGLEAASRSPDPVVRSALLDVLRQCRCGDAARYAEALGDGDHRVRLSAVRGLLSVGELSAVAGAADDSSRDVRIALAEGIAARWLPGRAGSGECVQALGRLAGDQDPLVRAAALKAAGRIGCPPPLAELAVAALGDPAWQVRAGAAEGLGGADPSVSADPLVAIAADPHPDVRKAAVIALAALPSALPVQDALRMAATDSDADVRAFARRALALADH